MRKYAATEGAVLALLVFVLIAAIGYIDLPVIVWLLFGVAVASGVAVDVLRARTVRR